MRSRTMGLVALLAACGSSDEMGLFGESLTPPSAGDERGATAGGAVPPGEEVEIESIYQAPVATGNVVWIPNPASGRVALVDAATLRVRTVEAGNGPTWLAGVPGQSADTTVVLNVLSEDATLLRAEADGTIASKTFPTARSANSLAFSADGRWAVAWADARKIASAPRTEGFQDLTILDLVNGTSTILAVGYRPVSVGFAAARAYAVTQDGVALVELGPTPRVTKNVAISVTPTEDPGTRDVIVAKDGTRAFVRRDGTSAITVVDLEADTRADVTLSGPVTDLDLTDSGDRAVAVVRSTAEVSVLPLADPEARTSVTIGGETIGSVALAPGGATALLYTNASAVERFTVLDLGASAFRTVRLYAPVLGVFAAPDAQHAVVLHAAGETAGAFSLAPIGAPLPAKIVATESPPFAVAVTNDRAVIAEKADAKRLYGAWLARMPQLMAERYPLASPPLAVGVVEGARRAFVAQAHPEGRLTFIDLESGIARTLTGFELSSRVVDGSRP